MPPAIKQAAPQDYCKLCFLHAQITCPQGAISSQCVGVPLPDQFATFQNNVVIRQGHQALDIFVDQQDGLPFLTQDGQTIPDFFTHLGGQTLGGLIQNQQLGVGNQCTTNGQHLLFT